MRINYQCFMRYLPCCRQSLSTELRLIVQSPDVPQKTNAALPKEHEAWSRLATFIAGRDSQLAYIAIGDSRSRYAELCAWPFSMPPETTT